MGRSWILGCGLLAGVIVCVASSGPVRGDDGDDDRLAKQLIAAAEKHSELQEVTAKHGRRAEIALMILQKQEVRVELIAQIRDMQATMSSFPQNRRRWLVEQWAVHDQKLASDMQLTALDRELGTLKNEERRMYEEELQKARESKKRAKPFNREAMLNELQRVEKESNEADVDLKAGVEAAARERHTTPRQVLKAIAGRLASLKDAKSPDVERAFLRDFVKRAGGDAWLDGKKPSPGKSKKGSARTRKNSQAQSDDAPF